MVVIQYYINVHGSKYSTGLMYIHMGIRATVIHYLINVRTPKKEKVRKNPEQEQIWNGFIIYQHNWLFRCSKNYHFLERSKSRTVSKFP